MDLDLDGLLMFVEQIFYVCDTYIFLYIKD